MFLASVIRVAIRNKQNEKIEGWSESQRSLKEPLTKNVTKEVVTLCKNMSEKGIWSEFFPGTVMISLQEKTYAIDREDHWAVSLVLRVS